MAEGRLCLVVGPSGSGKDSLIAGAAAALADDAGFVFPRREITRSADAGGENHVAISAEDFAARRDGGGYALAWDAHGLSYGIPASIDAALAQGNTVVVNVSRTVIAAARAHYSHVRVLHVTAPLPVLAQRIAARGRECAEDVEARLARAGDAVPSGPDVVEICNDGRLETAVAAFVAAIRG
jgi:phosphonate metabolism protein PhnN/1,5-bisphosphokinase (PRPP-forming)